MKSIDEYKFQTLKCEKCHKCYSKEEQFLKHIDNCNGMIKKNQKPRYDSYPNVSGIGEILHELVSLRKEVASLKEIISTMAIQKNTLCNEDTTCIDSSASKSSKAFDSSAPSNVFSNSYDSTYVAKNNDIHIMSLHTQNTKEIHKTYQTYHPITL